MCLSSTRALILVAHQWFLWTSLSSVLKYFLMGLLRFVFGFRGAASYSFLGFGFAAEIIFPLKLGFTFFNCDILYVD